MKQVIILQPKQIGYGKANLMSFVIIFLPSEKLVRKGLYLNKNTVSLQKWRVLCEIWMALKFDGDIKYTKRKSVSPYYHLKKFGLKRLYLNKKWFSRNRIDLKN